MFLNGLFKRIITMLPLLCTVVNAFTRCMEICERLKLTTALLSSARVDADGKAVRENRNVLF